MGLLEVMPSHLCVKLPSLAIPVPCCGAALRAVHGCYAFFHRFRHNAATIAAHDARIGSNAVTPLRGLNGYA